MLGRGAPRQAPRVLAQEQRSPCRTSKGSKERHEGRCDRQHVCASCPLLGHAHCRIPRADTVYDQPSLPDGKSPRKKDGHL